MIKQIDIKSILIFIFLGINLPFLTGQIISNETMFEDLPFFNEQFIKEHKIKSISGKLINYKLGDKFRETGEYKSYFFNEKGQLIKEVEGNESDPDYKKTISTYKYDERGNLTVVNSRYLFHLQTIVNEYDEQNRIARQELRQDYNLDTLAPVNHQLDDSFTETTEFFTYIDLDKQQHQSVYINNGELPYKDIFIYYNDDKKIIEKNESFRRISNSRNYNYFYDENQRISTIKIKVSTKTPYSETLIFEYDEKGNLKQKKVFKNEELLTRYEIIYKGENNFINDVLIQDVTSNFIKIYELRTYTFYED